MLKIFFACIVMCISSIPMFVNAESVEIESAIVVRELVRLSSIKLIVLGEDGLEDIPKQCRITNPQVEEIIREYAYNYKGGKTPMHIARALDDLMRTLDAIIDTTGDNDGILSEEEKAYWKSVVTNRNSLFLLWCLHQGYKDVSRK